MRHAAAGASFSSSHSVGISKPARCAALNMASPGIAVTSLPSIQIVQVGCPEGISAMCDTVGSCDSAGCVYRSSKLMRCSPSRPALGCAAGPVPAPGVARSAHPPQCAATATRSRHWVPGAPARREQPPVPCHPQRGPRTSGLHHRFVATRPDGLADPLGTSLFLYVDSVVVGELAHRRPQDRGRGYPEAAEREALHMSS